MAELLPQIKPQYFDSNGNPLVGGKLYSYEPGTVTPKATYTDYTGDTPNTNPVILDANGQCDVWVRGGSYKFVLTDANDVVQWTKDNVPSLSDLISSEGTLAVANNLSDLADATEALTNLGIGSLPTDVTTLQEEVTQAQTDIGTLQTDVAGKIDATEKAAANGVASLDGSGKVPITQLPATAITSVHSVADIAARDALIVEEGDVAIVSDSGDGTAQTYIYDGTSWVVIQGDAALQAHIADTGNPHGVTATQVGKDTAQWNADKIQGVAVSATSPTEGQALVYDGTSYVPGNVSASGGGGSTNYNPNPYYQDGIDDWTESGLVGVTTFVADLDDDRFDTINTGSVTFAKGASSANLAKWTKHIPLPERAIKKGYVTIEFDYSTDTGFNAGDLRLYVAESNGLSVSAATLAGVTDNEFGAISAGGFTRYRARLNLKSDTVGINIGPEWRDTSSTVKNVVIGSITIGPTALLDMPVVTDWQDYTPTWTAATTNPSIGNGILVGSYKRVGDTLHARIRVVGGSTTTSGSGNYAFGLPSGLTINSPYIGDDLRLGYGSMLNSGTARYAVIPNAASSTTVKLIVQQNADASNFGYWNAVVSNSSPFTFGPSDCIDFEYSVPITEWANSSAVMSTTALMNETEEEEKILSADVTTNGVVSDLTFTGLTVGKKYRISGVLNFQFPSGSTTDDALNVAIDNGAQRLSVVHGKTSTKSSGSNLVVTPSLNIPFTASDTTLTFTVASASSTGFIGGDGTKNETYVVLENRPDFTVYGGYSEPNRTQTKYLAADVASDGVISNLTFSNLTIGKWYEATGTMAMHLDASSTDDVVLVEATHNSQVISDFQFQIVDSTTGSDILKWPFAFKFKAEATSLTFVAVSASTNSKVLGNGARDFTHVQLAERNDLIETTAW